jgi:hypothetical protein
MVMVRGWQQCHFGQTKNLLLSKPEAFSVFGQANNSEFSCHGTAEGAPVFLLNEEINVTAGFWVIEEFKDFSVVAFLEERSIQWSFARQRHCHFWWQTWNSEVMKLPEVSLSTSSSLLSSSLMLLSLLL